MIYGNLEGSVCITRLNPLDPNIPPRDKFFKYPEELDELVAYCNRWSHEDTFCTPHLNDGNGRRKTNMTAGQVAFGDADSFKPSMLELEPSIIVRTSPEKSHVYWLIEDSTDPLELETLSHAVSLAHPKDSTGYDVGWATNKLLRVPGTTNNKYGEPYEVNYEVTGLVYTVEEFKAVYDTPDRLELEEFERSDIPEREEAMEAIQWTVQLQELLTESYAANQGYSRYVVLHKAIQELFRCGATNEQAFAILQNHSLNKWAEDNISDADQRLWDDIIRARAKSELENSDVLSDLDADLLPEQPEARYDLLREGEHELLKPTFIDLFADWSGAKTKTARVYQEAAAFGVLSTVFSELAHLPMNFGPEYLNMWFIIAGRSTIDRKSTVMRHMMQVLDYISDDDYEYDLGGNFTTEGIAKATLNKSNRSGIIVRDEFQGLLQELEKNYMSGAKGQLTMMYDGNIPGRLRASEDTTRKAKVKFALSFYGLGIANQITDLLTEEDFYSGFLTRFIWVTPPRDYIPPEVTDGFELQDMSKSKHDDKFIDLAETVRSARTYFELWYDGHDSPTLPIEVAPEAHERMRMQLEDISSIAKRLGKEQFISSGQRLSHSTYKAAACLAMIECRDRVELRDVLAAINYSSSWFSNMINMSEKISSSDWERQLENVTKFLEKRGKKMTKGALYREFRAQYKPRDFHEVLEALQSSGYIRLTSEVGRHMVEYLGA